MDFEVFCFCWVWFFLFLFLFWGGAGPQFLLCLLTEMTVVCVERGHPLPLLGPPTSLFGIPSCAE